MVLLPAAIFASIASVLAFLFTDMSSSASSSSGNLQWQIMRTASEAEQGDQVFPCKKCPKVFSCQQAMAGHMKGHSTRIPKRRKKTDHSNPPHAVVFEHGEASERPDPQLDRKGKQVAAFGINPNLALTVPPQFNTNRNLIIREPVMPLNPFQAFPPPPPENFIPFGVPILERPLGYAGLEETYSPPVFNNPHVSIAYNPVMRYLSNTLVNPLGMYPIKRYVQRPSFLQTGYEDACYVIDGAKGSTGGENKHDQELDLNLPIASAGPTYKKETADEDLDLELHL